MIGKVSRRRLLQLVNDGKLTALHRPAWMSEASVADLHLANAGCMNAAARIAAALAPEWTWRMGYDGLAELAWREDQSVVIRSISIGPAHALLIGVCTALVMGPAGVQAASECAAAQIVAASPESTAK